MKNCDCPEQTMDVQIHRPDCPNRPYNYKKEAINYRVTLSMIHAVVTRELAEPIPADCRGYTTAILVQIASLCEAVGIGICEGDGGEARSKDEREIDAKN